MKMDAIKIYLTLGNIGIVTCIVGIVICIVNMVNL